MQRKKEVQANGLEKKRRSILCPKCGHRLLDASVNTKAQLVTPTRNCNPDFVIKCRHCSSEIGVIKTEQRKSDSLQMFTQGADRGATVIRQVP